MNAEPTRVLLMNMPFVSVSRPSIGISLLKARLAEEGFYCKTAYPNLRFAEMIGLDRYTIIDQSLSHALFAGDWLFAQQLFEGRLDTKTYLATAQHNSPIPTHFEALLEAREFVEAFLEGCIESCCIADYDVIGFTSVFQQNLASLALARRIKEAFPEKVTLMGGANCEGVMGQELLRQFPWIDYVIGGEADYSLAELLKRLKAKQPLDGVAGLVFRQDGKPRVAAPQDRVHNLDALPDPDFEDYFEALEASRLKSRISPSLLFESARGCWWGAKSHCTFCGLNGDTMAFRFKSAPRVLEELERQIERHQIKRFQAVDNILSQQYFRTLLPALKERRLGIKIFYEIKSNLKPGQVKLLKEAGVWAVQPGVESLSSHVLKLMKKGVTAIQNIQLLKSCREQGVEAAWNLLFGFPGETEEDYAQMAELLPALYHLRPPGSVAPIRMDRFSPNFNDAEGLGLTQVQPFAMYHYLYPLPPEGVANLAYFFEYKYEDGRNPHSLAVKLEGPLKAWKTNKGGDLVKKYGQEPELMVIDTRPEHEHKLYPFQGIQRELYEYCDEIRGRNKILQFAARRTGSSVDEIAPSVDRFLSQMLDLQLMVREGNQYLSLAVQSGVEYQGLEKYQRPPAA